MIRIRSICCFSAIVLLSGCSASQLASTQATLAAVPAELAAACSTAQKAEGVAQATVKGGAANTVASISQFIDAGCGTAQAVAAIAADPTSTAWLADPTTGLAAQVTAAAQGS